MACCSSKVRWPIMWHIMGPLIECLAQLNLALCHCRFISLACSNFWHNSSALALTHTCFGCALRFQICVSSVCKVLCSDELT